MLSGGTGGAKLARGMLDAVGAENLSVLVNTGDDIEIYGAHVSPDPDLVTFWLADAIDERGWGLEGDSFHVMDALRNLGVDVWFNLGDRDLAWCLERARLLGDGETPTAAIADLAARIGVRAAVLPMCDEPVRTWVNAGGTWTPFQEFMIRQQASGDIEELEFRGVESARATGEALAAIEGADAIVIGPSNPLASIAPILAVPGIREALAVAGAPIIAVSPIVGGRVLKGPTAAFMAYAGLIADADGVADYYGDLLDGVVADEPVEGLPTLACDVMMADAAGRLRPRRTDTRVRPRARGLSSGDYRLRPMSTAAVLPVKRFPLAKTRLGRDAGEELRSELARAMAADVLDALVSCDALDLVVVVSGEPDFAAAADAAGAVVIDDGGGEPGQSAAVNVGVAAARLRDASTVVCVPGDCPALDPGELRALLAVADRGGHGRPGSPRLGHQRARPHAPRRDRARVRPGQPAPSRSSRRRSRRGMRRRRGAVAALRRRHGRRSRGARRRARSTRRARAAHARGPRGQPQPRRRTVGQLSARPLGGIAEIEPGDDLAAAIVAASAGALSNEAVVVAAHTVVSKAEGALRDLGEVTAGERALELAAGTDRDPRLIQVILDESAELIRAERGVLICRTPQGLVCANAGVDASNSPAPDTLVLLPRDPDGSARKLRQRVRDLTGTAPAVVITDSFGRAWRNGQVDVAIGVAGLAPLEDWRGRSDANGRILNATWIAIADAVAATADLVRAKDSREPVVLVEGLGRYVTDDDGPGAVALQRPPAEDLFS